MIDKDKFLTRIDKILFHGKITEKQKSGMQSILTEWENRKLVDPRLLAYVFATTFHETGRTMQPVKEMGGVTYLTKNYDVKGKDPSRARQMGNTSPGDGVRYCGRGYCQLTWKSNYAKFGKEIGVDLVTNPDRAMEEAIAAKIILTGMLDSKCSFTGIILTKYITASSTDFISARKTVNGLDRAQDIAGYARAFLAALS